MKLANYCLTTFLLVTAAGCDRLERDIANAPDDSGIERYGLENAKLGDSRDKVTQQLQTLLAQPLQCAEGKTGLGEQRKAFVLEECTAVSSNGVVGRLWDEPLSFLKATFIENQLVGLELHVKTSGDYQALYEAHGNKILNLFGKPDETASKQVQWQREGDEALLNDLGGGKVGLEIRNKKVMQGLHHKG
ncbi:MAG: hypothetical protein ACK4RS_01355 [Thiothrix sp.]